MRNKWKYNDARTEEQNQAVVMLEAALKAVEESGLVLGAYSSDFAPNAADILELYVSNKTEWESTQHELHKFSNLVYDLQDWDDLLEILETDEAR